MKKKILLIEDDQIFANVYRNKLLLDGFEVEVAYDGEAGMELVHSFQPDTVLLDLLLPKVTGIELITRIRREPQFQELPVIAFTNSYLANTVQNAWKAGATKCLSKTDCTPNQVIGTLRSLFQEKAVAPPLAAPVRAAVPTAQPSAQFMPDPDEDPDRAFQAELRQTFFGGLPSALATLRAHLQELVKAENEPQRLQAIRQLLRRTNALAGNASLAGISPVSEMAKVFEALLRELQDKPASLNASTLRTVASAIDFLGILSEQRDAPVRPVEEATVLVVDDEAISRRAVTYALEKAKLKSVSVEDPMEALQRLTVQSFDLVFLDVDMPNMNGFELCGRLRALAGYKKTPVVFVTSLNDFKSRANSTMSGGNDFIAKPFLFVELAVKAQVHLLRSQLETVQA